MLMALMGNSKNISFMTSNATVVLLFTDIYFIEIFRGLENLHIFYFCYDCKYISLWKVYFFALVWLVADSQAI